MRLKLRVTAFVLAAIGFVGIYTPVEAQVAPNNKSVLILGSTVEPGLSGVSLEEAKALELGYTVVIDSDAAWRGRSAFDFASFRAIILGDRACLTFFTTSPDLDAALANRTVWGPAITGNIVAVGTDPTFHSSYFRGLASQGDVVTESGIASKGGSCSGVVSVCVPHDRRPGASCIDGGALFSSIP